MAVTYYTAAEVNELKQEIASLQQELQRAENRLKRATTYYQLNVAEQIQAGALMHLWSMLGATSQTQAVDRINNLLQEVSVA